MADDVPDDILRNILARLPSKPLLRSRCVSKRWNNLISDPYFMKVMRSCRKMLLFSPPFYILDGSESVHPPGGRLRYLFERQSDVYRIRILGTINGIVVLIVDHQLILYNPFTGASKQLDDPYFPPDPSCKYQRNLYGFCDDDDDLMFIRFRDLKTCDVFNFKTNLWTMSEILIQDAHFGGGIQCEIGSFANGFFYWIASNKIIVLNVRKMILSEISRPAFSYQMESIFGTLHGCLCMITLHNNYSEFDVWVMKEHEVWSIVDSIQLPFEVFELLHMTDCGKVHLVDFSTDLIVCDILKKSHETVNIRRGWYTQDWLLQAIEYVESLISPSDICGI